MGKRLFHQLTRFITARAARGEASAAVVGVVCGTAAWRSAL